MSSLKHVLQEKYRELNYDLLPKQRKNEELYSATKNVKG